MPKKTMFPSGLFERLTQQYGRPTAERIERASRTERPPSFRVNTLVSSETRVLEYFREQNRPLERMRDVLGAFCVPKMTSHDLLDTILCHEGAIYVQGFSSMVPPLVLDPQPGESVLDLCAAPGSKCTQMAALMQGVGRLVAVEQDPVRFEKLQFTLQRQRASMVEAVAADAVRACQDWPEQFDRILADVPCSAEGRIVLSDPRSVHFWSEKNAVAHAKIQRRLLRAAVSALKPGGVLVYSTCTLSPKENEEMVAWALREFPSLAQETVRIPGMAASTKQHATILPDHRFEGFFVARFRKTASPS